MLSEFTKLAVSKQNGIASKLYLICLALVCFPFPQSIVISDCKLKLKCIIILYLQVEQLVSNLVKMQDTWQWDQWIATSAYLAFLKMMLQQNHKKPLLFGMYGKLALNTCNS